MKATVNNSLSLQDLPPAYSCAGAHRAALIELDGQLPLGEEGPAAATARINTALTLAELAHTLADGVDDDFCQSDCNPANCVVRTGETILEINRRVLQTSGTEGKHGLLARLDRSDRAQTYPVGHGCPVQSGRMPLDYLTLELSKGLDPEYLAKELGLGNETPKELSGGRFSSDEPIAYYLEAESA